MPEVQNFDNMVTSTVKFESHNEVFGDVMDRNYVVINFISKFFF